MQVADIGPLYIFQNSPVYLIVGIGEMQLARLHETPANDERRSKMQLSTTVGSYSLTAQIRNQIDRRHLFLNFYFMVLWSHHPKCQSH